MADTLYYISQQHGNDSNDGLSAATAWATLTKAFQTIPTPSSGNRHICYIGSGTYREKPIPLYPGLSANEPIIYAGDSDSLYLTSDTKGRVRITGCDVNDYPQSGTVLDATSVAYLELQDVYVDGTTDSHCVMNWSVCRRVYATGYNGFYATARNCINYDCTVLAYTYAFGAYFTSAAFYMKNYRCIISGGMSTTGFWCKGASNADAGVFNYSCIVVGCGQFSWAQISGTCYIRNYNCTSLGNYNYTYTSMSGNNSIIYSENCLVIGSTGLGGYNTNCQVFFCGSDACTLRISGSTGYCGYRAGTAAKHISLDLKSLLSINFMDTIGLLQYYAVHNRNNSTSYNMTLASERLYAFTPEFEGQSMGVWLNCYTLASSGTITIELQKYVGSVWVTQKSKTKSVADLVTGTYNQFLWDTGTGDDALTKVAGTWRFRITADSYAQSSAIYGSGSTTPSLFGDMVVSEESHSRDLAGAQRLGPSTPGVTDTPSVVLDLSVYNTAAPSIKILGCGEKILKLPVKANTQTTVSYQARHDGAGATVTPQIRLEHRLITTQTSSHSAGANTWQALTVTVTPTFDGVIDVILSSRDESHNAWFSDPVVT